VKFLMLVCRDAEPDTADAPDQMPIDEWVETYDAAGVRVLGDVLEPASATTVVRRRDGELLVTQGPYAESSEWIVGFDVLECESLEAAVEVAGKHEMARNGRLELRAFAELD
jgi:hypothetical protein